MTPARRRSGTLTAPRRVHDRDVKPHVSHVTQLIVAGKLAHFIRGGQLTAGGVMQAVTSAAQDADPDTAYEMEAAALPALRLAAAL